MKLKVNSNLNNGDLFYSEKEHEFNSIPELNSDIILLLKYINIGFDSESGNVTQIWGYHNNFNWNHKKLQSPKSIEGEFELNMSANSGDNKRIKEADSWITFYDKQTGWICIGDNELKKNYNSIEFFKNTILTLDNFGNIKSLWLRPIFFEKNF